MLPKLTVKCAIRRPRQRCQMIGPDMEDIDAHPRERLVGISAEFSGNGLRACGPAPTRMMVAAGLIATQAVAVAGQLLQIIDNSG
jgi:hypothetical protein